MKKYEFLKEVNGNPIPKGAQSIKIQRDDNYIIYTLIGKNGSCSVHQIIEGDLDKLKRTIKDVRDEGIFNIMLAKVFNAMGYPSLPGYNNVSNSFLGI